MKVQLVTPYRVSLLQRYEVTVRGNVTSVYPPLGNRSRDAWRVAWCRIVMVEGSGMLKFAELYKWTVESVCCVLCDGDYCVSESGIN